MITSGLPFRETFRKRHTAERTNNAETRLGEQSENMESCRENLWSETQVKGPQERNRHKNREKGVGKLSWFMSGTQTLTSLPHEGEPAGNVSVTLQDCRVIIVLEMSL